MHFLGFIHTQQLPPLPDGMRRRDGDDDDRMNINVKNLKDFLKKTHNYDDKEMEKEYETQWKPVNEQIIEGKYSQYSIMNYYMQSCCLNKPSGPAIKRYYDLSKADIQNIRFAYPVLEGDLMSVPYSTQITTVPLNENYWLDKNVSFMSCIFILIVCIIISALLILNR